MGARVGVQCFAAGLLVFAAACANYRPMPLQNTAPPDNNTVRLKASEIQHPILKPVTIDFQQGLTPDQIAVMAVILNPSLRAARDQNNLAAAQTLAAGILPNPQLNFNEDIPNGGTDQGSINDYALGLSWEVTQLISHDAKVRAAQAGEISVNLDVAWQEWQIAETAKTAAYDLLALRARLALQKENVQWLDQDVQLVKNAVDSHEKTVLDLAAAQSAGQDAQTALLSATRDVAHQELLLKRALGLPPESDLPKLMNFDLPTRVDLPDRQQLVGDLENHRMDLLALRRGYDSQEETLRAAVLEQFPKINLGFNKARDNTNVKSLGFGVIVDIPIFDRNQGNIAMETATRQKLFDEYNQRVFEAKSDVAEALDDLDNIVNEIAADEQAAESSRNLVDTYRTALDRGDADALIYYTARSDYVQKQVDIVTLKQELMDNLVALELATGRIIPQPTAATQISPSTSEAP